MPRVLFLFLLIVMVHQMAPAEDLTFEQAAGLMLGQNPALAQKEIESEISKKAWSQSKALYFPRLDFVQSWTQSNNPVYVFGTLLNQRRFSEANFAIDSLNRPEAISDNSSRFQLGWLLFDFGRRESQINSAKITYNISNLQIEAARADLLQELVRRYYAVSLTRLRIETSEDALTSARARYEQARERVDTGLAVNSDLLSAQVFSARREQEKIEAEQQLQNATAALWELLGQQTDREITTAPLQQVEFPEQDLSWWMQEMKAHRPELKMVQEANHIEEKQVRIQQSNFLPDFQVWSSYEWHGSSLDYTGNSWGAGFELKWNLLRGGADYEQLAAAKLKAKQTEEKQRETENALWLQQQVAFHRFQSAKEKCNVSKAALEQALENRRIYAERYASGLVSIQDSLQADSAYSDSRLIYSQNLYELYVAYAELLAVAGKTGEILKFPSAFGPENAAVLSMEDSK
jgi:outer membrane protein